MICPFGRGSSIPTILLRLHLTLKEKIHGIKRVQKSSQSSIEQKQFKKAQVVETLKDLVSWYVFPMGFLLISPSISSQAFVYFDRAFILPRHILNNIQLVWTSQISFFSSYSLKNWPRFSSRL
tara:strand:+ start:205 stop:573 length:369 start_codon:yes stop_codon:yes gene_type:complete